VSVASVGLYVHQSWHRNGVLFVRPTAPLRFRGTRRAGVELALHIADLDPPVLAVRSAPCKALALEPPWDATTVEPEPEPDMKSAELIGVGELPVRASPGADVVLALGVAEAGAVVMAGAIQGPQRKMRWDLGSAIVTGWVPADRVAPTTRRRLGRSHRAQPPQLRDPKECIRRLRLIAAVGKAQAVVGSVDPNAQLVLVSDDATSLEGLHQIDPTRFPVDLAPHARLFIPKVDLASCTAGAALRSHRGW
jgi:hypothetical protein